MTDVTVALGTVTVNSNAVFPAYNNSMFGYITSAFAIAADSTFSPNNPDPSTPPDVLGATVGYIGVVGVGGGANPNNFVVALQGALPKSYFSTVTFPLGGGTTLNSADAVFNDPDTSAPGYSVWRFADQSGDGYAPNQGDNVTFTDISNMPTVTLAVPTLIDGTGVLLEWTPSNLGGAIVDSYEVLRDGESIAGFLDPDVLTYSDETNTPQTEFTYQIIMHCGEAGEFDSNEESITTGTLDEVFNCACELVSAYQTLAQLRVRMAIQCGFAAMSANLPAGQIAEFNEFLFTAQRQLYLKFRAQRTERFFRWTMTPGERYYGLAAAEGDCTLQLNPLGITWVGFEDLNRAWYRLTEGIDPVFYTRANINFGWPTRYEIRSCIEIFPAPQAAYTLWIKGDIGLAPFTADSDRPTFDDEAILLFAVANWKSAKGKSDAQTAMGQATQRVQDLTARKHGTYRFVPSTYVQNPATPPRFLPLGSQQS